MAPAEEQLGQNMLCTWKKKNTTEGKNKKKQMTSHMFSTELQRSSVWHRLLKHSEAWTRRGSQQRRERQPSLHKSAVFGQRSPKQVRSVCDSAALRTHTCPWCTSAALCAGPLSLLGAVSLRLLCAAPPSQPVENPPQPPQLAFGCTLLHIIVSALIVQINGSSRSHTPCDLQPASRSRSLYSER